MLVEATTRIAYIHGDVAENGKVPSGSADPYDQMLLSDSGNTGLSMFQAMVEGEGYAIEQFYDRELLLDSQFLAAFDVVIFGLHQKIWSPEEKSNLDTWLRNGGGMLIYSDSAAGGKFNVVGAQNPVGQSVVNNLISQYGMEVTVDQANGVKAFRAGPGAVHPIISGRAVLEGEGVSPIAVDPGSKALRLIPYEDDADYKVSGSPDIPHQQNLTIQNAQFAALALTKVGSGRIIAMFDRQPMWNNGPGSDIEKRDNLEILRRIIRNLVGDLDDPPGFVTWQYEEFGSDISNPLIAGPTADPNDDNIDNLLAYASDLPGRDSNQIRILSQISYDPKTPDPSDDTFHFSFRRATGGAEGVIYHVDLSETLHSTDWSPVDFSLPDHNLNILESDPDGDGSAELIEVTVPANNRLVLFGRLRVEYTAN